MDSRAFAPRIPAATSRLIATASRGPLARAAAKTLVAGESVDDAIRVTGDLAERGSRVSWLPLFKPARSADDLLTVSSDTIGALTWLAAAGTDAPDVTLDLAAFGLFSEDVSAGVLLNALRDVGQAARNAGVTLTLTVSEPLYINAVYVLGDELRQDFPEVGIVLPTRLRRGAEDLDDVARPGRRVRLTTERLDAAVGMTSARESGNAFVDITKVLLDAGVTVSFDTDDALLLDIAASLVTSRGAGRAEIVAPLGVSLTDQRDETFARRVVVPYGSQWGPYVAHLMGARPSLALSLPNPVRRRS